jgi:hypothetical protein
MFIFYIELHNGSKFCVNAKLKLNIPYLIYVKVLLPALSFPLQFLAQRHPVLVYGVYKIVEKEHVFQR